MIVFCHGMVKSASSFATQIVLGLIESHIKLNGGRIHSITEYVDQPYGLYLDDFVDIDAIVKTILDNVDFKSNDFIVLKIHRASTPFLISLIDSGEAALISTYRDPRDVALSLLDAAKLDRSKGLDRFTRYHELSDTTADVKYQIGCMQSWAQSSKTLFIDYQDLANNPVLVANRMASHLGIGYDNSVVDKLLSNKSEIWEFNKGIVNRWIQELDEGSKMNWLDMANEFYSFIDSNLRKERL